MNADKKLPPPGMRSQATFPPLPVADEPRVDFGSAVPAERSDLSDLRQAISALADGRGDAGAGSAQWREQPEARETWHLYHLIGDVMRSEDLASTPARDAAFLAGLRERLAAEPVPLAPAALQEAASAGTRRMGWRAPAAVAAGFVVVAGALTLLRPIGAGGWSAGEAVAVDGSRPEPGQGLRVVANPTPAASGSLVAEGQMIRDARLDAYLRAHQAARGNAAAALPGGSLRSVEMLLPPTQPVAPASASR